jgi:hypothetical protein
MNRKDLFVKSLNTMLYSWGGDTPPEAMWALTELVEFYNANVTDPNEQIVIDDNLEEGHEYVQHIMSQLEGEGGLNEDLNRFNQLI